jgi:hypothetical protein
MGVCKIKNKFIKAIATVVLSCSLIPNIVARADDLKIGVAPTSFEVTKTQSLGVIKDFKILIKNNAVFAPGDGKENLYVYKVNLSFNDKVTDNYENAKDWVTLSGDKFNLKPSEEKIVDIHVDIPKGAKGRYMAILDISQIPIVDSNAATFAVNVEGLIQVPIFIELGEDGSMSVQVDKEFDVTGNNVTTNTEDNVLTIVKGLYSKNIKENLNKVLYGPLKYNKIIDGRERIYYDIPKMTKVYLKDVLTTAKTSKSKYAKVNREIPDNLYIQNIQFDGRYIRIFPTQDSDNVYEIEFPNESIVQDINLQLINLLPTIENNETPSFEWMSSNIRVNELGTQVNTNLFLEVSIDNTGEAKISPGGKVKIYDPKRTKLKYNINGSVQEELSYSNALIPVKASAKIYAQIPQEILETMNGNYMLSTEVLGFGAYQKESRDIAKSEPLEEGIDIQSKYKTSETIEYELEIKSFRYLILIGFVASIIIPLIIMGILLRVILKIKKKNKLKKVGDIEFHEG